jgi:hypothetical protein
MAANHRMPIPNGGFVGGRGLAGAEGVVILDVGLPGGGAIGWPDCDAIVTFPLFAAPVFAGTEATAAPPTLLVTRVTRGLVVAGLRAGFFGRVPAAVLAMDGFLVGRFVWLITLTAYHILRHHI